MPAGYSGTPLAKKLGIKPGASVLLDTAPPTLEKDLGTLPEGVLLKASLRGSAAFDLMLTFHTRAAQLEARLGKLVPRLTNPGGLWICWPKGASGVETDINREVVRELGLATGLVDIKVAAIDETWSGLRFAYRKE